ncbi:MAG: DUF4595 domain-containing protein [Prevotella sp.]|nr:DUF4595 domain-containing protein [Prevotella sp.]
MKTFRLIGMALIALVFSFSFSSCSDDDDDDSNRSSSSSSNVSVITTDDGEQYVLVKVGSWKTYDYDSEGRCTELHGDYSISYNPCVITPFDEDWEYANVTFNNSGYISKMEIYFPNEDDIVINCSYDSDGHLTNIKGSDTYYNGNDTYQYTLNCDFTWKSGNLISAGFTKKGEDRSISASYTYEYGNTKNKYQQYTDALWDPMAQPIIADDFSSLCFIGLFGKGTSKLPASYKIVWVYDNDIETYDDTLEYTLNGNGTIQTEKVTEIENNDDKPSVSTFNYTYSLLSIFSRSTQLSPITDELANSNETLYTKRVSKHNNHLHHGRRNTEE